MRLKRTLRSSYRRFLRRTLPRFSLPLALEADGGRHALATAARGTLSGVVLLILLGGCAKKPDHVEGSKPKKEAKLPIEAVGIGSGDTTVHTSEDPKAPPSFTLRWEGGKFDVDKGGVDVANLQGPNGEIFREGKPVATFRAEKGGAKRETRRLEIDGNVVLQTIDRKQTLKAPHGEYRSVEKLVRMTGGVTASGTFGTLSGVPELWATPDLKLVGTPAMFAQKLKVPALITLAATAATGVARLQNAPAYTLSGNSGLLADVRNPLKTIVTVPPAGGGAVVVTLPSRGLTFRASGTVVLELDPKSSNEVRRMTTEAPVHVVQTTTTGTTTLEGKGATYDAKAKAATADVTVGGRVTLVNVVKDAKGTTTTTSRGDEGSAVLVVKPGPGANGLRSATLKGNVTVVSAGGGDGFDGKGERLVYRPKADGADVDLTGPVALDIAPRGLAFRFAAPVSVDLQGDEVRRIASDGGVNVVQTAPNGRTTLDGSSAVYDSKPGAATADLDLGGRVVIVNAVKDAKGATSTTTSEGNRGSAVLVAKPGKDESGLRSATLTGDVTVESRSAGDDTFQGTGAKLLYTPKGDAAEADLTGGVVLTRITKSKDADGKPVTNTVVSRCERAHAVIAPGASGDGNPLKNATLDGGVRIDVSGTNGQSFKGSGDKIVYAASGSGGKATMTGKLLFSGDTPSVFGDLSNTDTAVVTIGRSGLQTVQTFNSDNSPTTTTIKTRPRSPKKKGGKG